MFRANNTQGNLTGDHPKRNSSTLSYHKSGIPLLAKRVN
jgi:hypothetical protein